MLNLKFSHFPHRYEYLRREMKKYRSIFGIAVALFLTSCGVSKYAATANYPEPKSTYRPRGELQAVFIPSSEKGMEQRRAYVYLPEEYENDDSRYPVLYLLHGARGNETVWIDKGNLLHNVDSLTVIGEMSPTIIVLPNMNQYNDTEDYGHARLKSSLESFYEVDGSVERAFNSDVIPVIDSLFRTIPQKDSRAVAGLSIGAMQALHLSANFPDSFGYIGMFSPMVHSFLKKGPDNDFYRHLKEKQEIQFSEPPRLFSIMIGKTDFFYPSIKAYCHSLDKRGIPYELITAKGGHEWYNWEEFCNTFLKSLWK